MAHSTWEEWPGLVPKVAVRSQFGGQGHWPITSKVLERAEAPKAGNVHERHEGRGHVGEGCGAQDGAGAGQVACIEEVTRFQDGQGSAEARVEFDGQCQDVEHEPNAEECDADTDL